MLNQKRGQSIFAPEWPLLFTFFTNLKKTFSVIYIEVEALEDRSGLHPPHILVASQCFTINLILYAALNFYVFFWGEKKSEDSRTLDQHNYRTIAWSLGSCSLYRATASSILSQAHHPQEV